MRLSLISIIIQRFHSVRNPCWYDVNSQQGTEAESVGNEDIKAWLCLSYNAFELLEVRHWISKEISEVYSSPQANPLIRYFHFDFDYHCRLTIDKRYRPFLMTTNESYSVKNVCNLRYWTGLCYSRF